MTLRRHLVALGLLCPLTRAGATQRKSLGDPLRLGVERALLTSGLMERLLQGFTHYSGLKVLPAPGTSAQVLAALEQGEIDASLTDAPELELRLEKQGLAHDRHGVASGDLVLVGPRPARGRSGETAARPGGRDIAAALAALARAETRFLSAPEGSGAYLAELDLWRQAKVAPASPWYTQTPPGDNAPELAASQGGLTLVERGVWMARGPKSLAVWVEGDPRMAIDVQVMRSFRSSHPAAKLFVQWASGPQGSRAAMSAPGWRGLRR